MVRIPTNRPPTHPGEMLLTEFLEPLGLTQKQSHSHCQIESCHFSIELDRMSQPNSALITRHSALDR
jgi:hypothetical protein